MSPSSINDSSFPVVDSSGLECSASNVDSEGLYIIDGIGPFFRGYGKKRINWSKIPFENLETKKGNVSGKTFTAVRKDFKRFVNAAAAIGFNAVSLDDVAHLAAHDRYPDDLKRKINAYRDQYERLFDLAAARGLSVFLTTDIMFYNDCLERELGGDHECVIEFLERTFDDLFERFPQLGGIISRIGECDGIDVKHEFRSRLTIRTPAQARRYLTRLLPVFKRHDRRWIFRTWTVGAYSVGDLIWNPKTFDKVFKGIDDDHLIISLKYGPSDFYRFLELNDLFHHSSHRKIIELQTRREYEGFGEYPSFIGWDYQQYRERLAGDPSIVGACFWCQTGGWSAFRRRTFMKTSSVWNEINTYAALKIFKEGMSADEAIRDCAERWLQVEDVESLRELLRLSDEVVKELLYIDDFARRNIYFRRLRVPPLLSVFWDYVIISHSMRSTLRRFVPDGESKIAQGEAALKKIKTMERLAKALKLPRQGIKFQRDTFKLLAIAREYYFGDEPERAVETLRSFRKKYRKKYNHHYSVKLDLANGTIPKIPLRILFGLLIRQRRRYRVVDRVVTIRLLALLAPLFVTILGKHVPKFARKKAMGFDAVLK